MVRLNMFTTTDGSSRNSVNFLFILLEYTRSLAPYKLIALYFNKSNLLPVTVFNNKVIYL